LAAVRGSPRITTARAAVTAKLSLKIVACVLTEPWRRLQAKL